MPKHVSKHNSDKIILQSDNGSELSFNGSLSSERSLYDEDTGDLTRLRLFTTEKGEYVYSIVSGTGANKERRHYVISQEGDLYRINDGRQTLLLPPEMLFTAVFGLCGIDAEKALELMPAFEDNLRSMTG